MKNSNEFYIASGLYYTVKRIKNRIIYVPCDELKSKQRYFLNAIKWVYPYKTDTLTSAKIHAGKKWILKTDIKNFYDSVPYDAVEKAVIKVCRKIKQSENIISYLSLVTLNGKLPTGAPTSPHLANACFKPIDKEISRLASMCGVDYTRYVDDLTFSSYSKETLQFLEKKVREVLKDNGYNINSGKTKYISDNKQQNILGLVVNDYRVRLSKDFKRNMRAILHSYSVYKCDSAFKAEKHLVWNSRKEQQLAGYISYIKHVDNDFWKKLKTYSLKLEHKYFVIIPFFK